MTATSLARYACPECPETFVKAATLGGHVHAQHPQRRRPIPKWLRAAPVVPRHDGGLKRATDTWPARP